MQAEVRQRHGSEAVDSLEERCSAASESSLGPEEASTSASQTAAFRAAANVPKRHKRAKGAREAIPLHGYSHLPDFMRDNEFITAFYRVQYTPRQSLRSLFHIHNETGNIWTHLIGVVLFIILTGITIYSRPAPIRLGAEGLAMLETKIVGGCSSLFGKVHLPQSLWDAGEHIEAQLWSVQERLEGMLAGIGKDGLGTLQELDRRVRSFGDSRLQDLLVLETWLVEQGERNLRGLETSVTQALSSIVEVQWPARRWPVYVFTTGAILCLSASTLCHLFGCCNWHGAQTIWRFDYAGIVILIVASFVPFVYFSFLCDVLLRNVYLITTCSLGLGVCCVTLLDVFQEARLRPFRAGLFAGLGLWGVVPGLHACLAYGSSPAMKRVFGHEIVMGAIYLAGAGLYASRMPERFFPGSFDLAFNSHQLFHVAVVAAALIHYRGMQILVEWRDSTGGCIIPFAMQAITA